MAMLITKFHRLIQSRLLWATFLIVVIFSFVIWGIQMPDSSDQAANAAGRLKGENVTYDEYQRARFNTYMSLVLMSGRAINITPEIEEQLHELSWKRIATLREAATQGLAASNDEVVGAIRSFEFLQQEGRFVPQAYDQFEKEFLANFRATKREFEEHIRQEIIIQKLRAVLARLQLATPIEVQRTYNTLSDTFSAEYVLINTNYVANEVTVSEEDIQAYFTKDPERFTIPEKAKVKAAVFPVADYKAKVEVTDEQIQEYYDLNLEDFAKPQEKPEGDTNEFTLAATEYKTLDEVRGEIVEALRFREAGILAQTAADEFTQALSAAGKEGRAKFDAIAAESGIQLVAPAPFSRAQAPAELEDASVALTRAAFDLSDDLDYYYSNPVAGTNFIYVLSLIEMQPSRVPLFDEVRAEVEAEAREFATINALTEKAAEIQQAAIAGLAAGISFEETLKEYSLEVKKPEPFAINTMTENSDVPSPLIREILVRNAGEITEPVDSEDGILIGHIKSRTASAESSEAMRPQILNTLRRQVGDATFSDYQAYLLKRDGFEDLTRRRTPANAGEEEPPAAAEEAS